jgi:glycosyltransferase involved in cell wall biosynthesis
LNEFANDFAQTGNPGDKGWCTVVVPCYNEAARLRIESFTEFLSLGYPVRFLFVNDGSSDDTLAILEGLRLRHPDSIYVLDQQPNGGKAEAVRHGMLRAITLGNAAYTGFWDADLATPLSSIPDLLAQLTTRPQIEMVFGARVRLLGREIHRQAARHYLGRVFATVVSLLLRLPIYDTQCGAKLFRVTPEFEQILTQPFLSRWIFDVEILARFIARHQQDRAYVHDAIYEYPLPQWTDVAGSKVGSLDFIRAFGELIMIYRAYL